MRKASLFLSAILLLGMLFSSQVKAQGRIDLGRANSAQQCVDNNATGFTATFSFSSIESEKIDTEKGVFSNITMDNTYPSGMLGEPTVPAVNKLIAVPFGAKNISVEVKSFSTTVYDLADYGIGTLYPQQPLLRKDQKPGDLPFAYNEKAYAMRGFNEAPLAQIEIQGTMRGIQIATLTLKPVQYDAASNSIRVYNDIVVEVSYGQYDEAAAYGEFARTFTPYYAGIYRQMFNWRDDVYDQHPDLWQSPVKMLVITDRMFEKTIEDWANWKTLKGFYMDINYTDEIGNNANAIKSFIQQKYAETAPTFLMIMGDKNQVAASATGNQTHCVTDLYYMSVDGDEFPEMFHSRFPAETTAQMEAMLNKALEYEQYTMPDPSYLNNVLLIAGDDNGWGVTVGRPAIWYASNYYYNEEHGFANVYEYSHGQWSGCYNNLNTGVGFVNYTAHGSNTSWAGPSFTVNDVNNLTNVHKYFLAMGNCCEAADWGISGTCFGEAMVRAENKAAYAYIGSCPSTYWLNDYYFAVGATGRADGTMPSYEETTMGCYDAIWDDDAYNTVCAIPFIGNLASNAAQALGYELHVGTLYCWQAYHVLGDGSVMPFRVQPTENEVSHMPIFPIGMNTYEVSALPGSYVALSKGGELLGVGLVDESGVINVEVEPVTSSGEVTLCVTHPQHIPYIEEIPAAALEGAFIGVNEYTPTNVHVGEDCLLSINFKNVGSDATSGNVEVTLTCDDSNVIILNGTGSFGTLAPEEISETLTFSYNIAEGVADGTRFTFHTTATCGNDVWEGKAYVTAGEAVLDYNSFDWKGDFVPGDNFNITVAFDNKGHYMATNAVATMTSDSEYLTINSDSFNVGTIDPNGHGVATFNVTVSNDCPISAQIQLNFNLVADGGLMAEGTGLLKNECLVIFYLHDSYGDGWNGASLEASFSDGAPNVTMTIDENAREKVIEVYIGNGSHVTLTWHAGSWDGECSYDVKYPDGTVILHNNASGGQFDVSCSLDEPTTEVSPVTNLSGELADNVVVLTWDASVDAVQYLILRNGIGLDFTDETSFTDGQPTADVCTYCVIAIDANDNNSMPVCTEVEDVLDVEEAEVEFNIYPNPVNSTLYINGGSEYSYVMYNGMGQQVAAGNASGAQMINVSNMTKGVYFIRLTSGAQVSIQKVVVE